jgi:deazaflavin-dependent oxidoreductase (nitroreductase family)
MSRLADLARRLGSHDWFIRLIPLIVPADRIVGRLTHGRLVTFGLKELPSLLLTTTGRVSGQPRSNPVFYVRDGEDFVVSASNFGRPDHPAWSANLLADPDAVVAYRGGEVPVRARLTEGAERDRLIGLLTAVWPPYPRYLQRTTRTVRIFRLSRRDQQ